MMSKRSVERGARGTPVSAGYDRVRFTRPVFAGDTLTARYTIESVDDAAVRTRARVEVKNGQGETCLVATHILAWVSVA
jgi:acyl dehydratase